MFQETKDWFKEQLHEFAPAFISTPDILTQASSDSNLRLQEVEKRVFSSLMITDDLIMNDTATCMKSMDTVSEFLRAGIHVTILLDLENCHNLDVIPPDVTLYFLEKENFRLFNARTKRAERWPDEFHAEGYRLRHLLISTRSLTHPALCQIENLARGWYGVNKKNHDRPVILLFTDNIKTLFHSAESGSPRSLIIQRWADDIPLTPLYLRKSNQETSHYTPPMKLLERIHFLPRINISETATSIQNEYICDEFDLLKKTAESNISQANAELQELSESNG